MLAIVISIVVAISLSVTLRKRVAPIRSKLINVCLIYIVLLPLFGRFYWLVYEHHPSDFVFTSEILNTRRADIIGSKKEELSNAVAELNAIDDLLDNLSKKVMSAKVVYSGRTLTEFQTETYRYEFSFSESWYAEDGRLARAARLVIRDKIGNQLWNEPLVLYGPDRTMQKRVSSIAWETTLEEYYPPRQLLIYKEMIAPINARLDAKVSGLRSLTEQPLEHLIVNNWRPADFLYFSVVTQTTVGYGDILPNSTRVRNLVMVQVLLGLLLLGVAISWVATDIGPTKKLPDHT